MLASGKVLDQLIGVFLLFLFYSLYSLKFCPYSATIRVFAHLSDLVYLLQLILFILMTGKDYGSFSSDSLSFLNNYVFAWVLISSTYLQVMVYLGLSAMLTLELTRRKFCASNEVAD